MQQPITLSQRQLAFAFVTAFAIGQLTTTVIAGILIDRRTSELSATIKGMTARLDALFDKLQR
jgi:hypothetical protein